MTDIVEIEQTDPAEQIVDQARTWLGTKYHHQGRLKKSAQGNGGVDCIGLVVGVCKELAITDEMGICLAAYDQTNYGIEPSGERLVELMSPHLSEVEITNMKIGDVLLLKFWKEPQHVGILSHYPTGGLGLIHCNSSSGSVVEQPLTGTWIRMITHVYRFSNFKS
jgi:cell wall-associated NlpC family hydrolase